MASVELVAELPGHTEPTWCVAWNPQRSLLASCSTDRTVRIYGYRIPASSTPAAPSSSTSATHAASRPVFTYLTSIQTAHTKTIRSIAWSPDGKQLVTGSFDATVGIWEEVEDDEDDEEEDRDEDEDMDSRSDVAESHEVDSNGQSGVFRPAVASRRSIKVKEWECVTTLEGHESECKAVGYSSDGALLASCSRDKSVWVWEVQPDADFECISVMMEHTQDVKTIAWHPKEEILASASYDASILLYVDDPDDDWAPIQKLEPKLPPKTTDWSAAQVHSAPDGSQAPVDGVDGEDEQDYVVPPLVEEETVWTLSFSPCGRYLASGGDNGGIRIWARSGTTLMSRWVELAHVNAHDPRSCFSLSWGANSYGIDQTNNDEDLGKIVSAGGDGKVVIWSINPIHDVSITPTHVLPRAHGIHDVNNVAWCRTRRLMDDDDGDIGKSDSQTKEAVKVGMFASGGDDGSVKVWRLL